MRLPANLATSWYQWEVHAEETNLTRPFVFRIVNAHGTADERNSGGFYSTSWYLKRDQEEKPIKFISSTMSTLPSVSSATITASESPLASVTSAELLSQTAQDAMLEATATPTSTTTENTNAVGGTAIIGLTVAMVVTGALIIAGVWYLLKRRRRCKHKASSPASQYVASFPKQPRAQLKPKILSVYNVSEGPSELQNVVPCYELPDKTY